MEILFLARGLDVNIVLGRSLDDNFALNQKPDVLFACANMCHSEFVCVCVNVFVCVCAVERCPAHCLDHRSLARLRKKLRAAS